MSQQNKELYDFGNFRLDVEERRLERRDGVPQSGWLREKAFEVLVHLVRNKGRLVSKDELLSIAWPDAIVEEVNLNKAVHAIRQYLGEGKDKQKFIETVPKHGFRFVADVRIVDSVSPPVGNFSLSSAGKLGPPDRPSPQAAASMPRVIGIVSLILIGLLGIGALVVANSWMARERTASPDRDPDQAKAYDLYIRGKVKAGTENREETEAAVKLLQESVQLDPNLAEAHAQLARVYNTLAFKYAAGSERKQLSESAEVAIEKALELNPDLAEAHFARGLILWNHAKRFPHEQAIRAYRRSLELDPAQDETHHQLSMVYAHIGLMEEADRSLQTALDLNPNNTMARYRVANYLVWRGRSPEALAVLKTVPSEVSPLLVERMRAEALIQTGQADEAEAIIHGYLDRNPDDEGGSFTALKALLLARSGKYEEAEAAIQRAIAVGTGFGHFHHTAHSIAATYAAMKRPNDAVKWLENASEDGFPNVVFFEIDRSLDPVRDHTGFKGLMRKLRDQVDRFKSIV